MEQKCPKCGAPADELVPVDTALRVALKATNKADSLPPFVCNSCHIELSGQVSQGLKLRLEQEQREKNKVVLWKNRVALIKQARHLMSQKAYSEAAVAYEKYLRVLEMVYNLNAGQLTPEIFNNSRRSKELTVVASVYWDLVRIYDTSPKYGDRMSKAAAKLAQFLPFSTIFPQVVKHAENYVRTAKNPHVVRGLLKACNAGKGCFIATAAYGSPFHEPVAELRAFRDEILSNNIFGRSIIRFYYLASPPVADWIRHRRWARAVTRQLLRPAVFVAKKHLNSVRR